MSQKLYNMKFAAVYLALIAKVERKGEKAESVHQVTSWLTGYEVSDVLACLDRDVTYGDFFLQAPYYVPERIAITGKICGVRIEEIDDPRPVAMSFLQLSSPWPVCMLVYLLA